jgi:tRNA(adenine34) deaminase
LIPSAPVPASASPFIDPDFQFMGLALDEARLAAAMDEVPVGAVVVSARGPDGSREVLASAHNATLAERDPTAHAELLAIRLAARRLGYERLTGCAVYSTVEPCFMCAGALVLARVERVVFGVRDPKFGACASLGQVLAQPGLNHHIATSEGIRAEESRALLQEFFRSKR